ncbi:hypothetical protein A2870_03355 [Candidatus Curtissbacteria bacterium RIFCSPHIGHO2_01_FULL_41_11]|uniref:Uncharacterized protein n=1 Tax=Candidatus Curtissbacteria bacterium RIFCSPHIGHO2_01_FULL_41_11 TaxID=1797711 RepID=A0A1F5G5K9_9BACT|nr:MAG: hypothetical protein A2870_03355 [Candidatus Curtissbacteria bacterium RIFCSPHIGHO2_01_FULL_41_11]
MSKEIPHQIVSGLERFVTEAVSRADDVPEQLIAHYQDLFVFVAVSVAILGAAMPIVSYKSAVSRAIEDAEQKQRLDEAIEAQLNRETTSIEDERLWMDILARDAIETVVR